MSSPLALLARLRMYNDDFGSGYGPRAVDEPEMSLLIWGAMSKRRA